MEKSYLELGMSGMIICYLARLLYLHFSNKVSSSKVQDDIRAGEEKMKVDHNSELFELFTKTFEASQTQISDFKDEVEGFKDEISELKDVISNKIYMSPTDYQLLIKTYIALMLYNIEGELKSIVERNNINGNTLELTNKKIVNYIERMTNDSMNVITGVGFHKNVVYATNELIISNKQYIITAYSVPFEEYSESQKDSIIKKDDASKNISEITKYLSNKLVAKFQEVMKNTKY